MFLSANTGFLVDAADFDGTNDRLNATTTFGAASSKKCTCFFWIRIPAAASASVEQIICAKSAGAAQIVDIFKNGTLLIFQIKDATGNATANYQCTVPTTDAWHSVLVSFDVTPTAVGYGYIDDVATGSLVVSNNLNMGFGSTSQWYFGADFTPTNQLSCCVAQFWLAPGVLVDLSVAGNRRNFTSAGNKPIDFGSTGNGPTGVAPAIYLNLADGESAANWATNRTGNGNFTVTGALTTCASSPSD